MAQMATAINMDPTKNGLTTFNVRSHYGEDIPHRVGAYEQPMSIEVGEKLAKDKAKADEEVGFLGGIKHSAAGVAFRKWMASDSTFQFDPENPENEPVYIPTDEEKNKALDELNWSVDSYNAVAKYARTRQEWEENLKIIKDQREYRRLQSQADLANNLLSIVGEASADPTNLIPVFGASTVVGRVAYGVGSALLSSEIQRNIAGDSYDALETMQNGALFGLGVEAAMLPFKGGKAFGEVSFKFGGIAGLNTARLRSIAEANPNYTKHPFLVSLNTTLRALEAKSTERGFGTVQGVADMAQGSMKEAWRKLGISERGSVDTKDVTIKAVPASNSQQVHLHTQAPQGGFTAEEWTSNFRDRGATHDRNYRDYQDKAMRELNITEEEFDKQLRRSRDGLPTPFDNNENFQKAKAEVDQFYKEYGDDLLAARMVGHEDPETGAKITDASVDGTYEHLMIDRAKQSDFVERMPGKLPVDKLNAGIGLVSKLLLGSLKDSKRLYMFLEIYERTVRDPLIKEHDALMKKGKIAEANAIVLPDVNNDFYEWCQKQAVSDAIGYVDQGESIKRRLIENLEDNVHGNDYQRTKLPWSYTVQAEDGFCLADLMPSISDNMRNYNRKTSADLGLNHAFGVTSFREFSEKLDDELNNIGKMYPGNPKEAKKQKEIQRQGWNAAMNALYGRSGMDASDVPTWGNAIFESLRNLTFFGKNTFMGYLNHFEIAEGIRAFGPEFFFKSIPGIGRMFKAWDGGKMTKAERDCFLNAQFGKEVDVITSFRRLDETNLDRYRQDPLKAKLVTATQWVATNSPFTKYLNASQETIVNTARGELVRGLVNYAKKKSGKGFFMDQKTLARMGIADNDFKELVNAIRLSTNRSRKGEITINHNEWKKRILDNPTNYMNLRRLGRYVSDEVIQRNSLMDTFLWQGDRQSPVMNMLMQFKSFALRSYNKRLAKSLMRAEEGDAYGQMISMMLSGALGTLSFIGQTAATAYGMDEDQRRNYFKSVLGVESLEDIDSTSLANIATNGFMRSSMLAAPALVATSLGINTSIKSSTDIDYTTDRFNSMKGFDLDDFARKYFPAYSTVSGAYNLGASSANIIGGHTFNEDYCSPRDIERWQRYQARALRSLLPGAGARDAFINLLYDNE